MSNDILGYCRNDVSKKLEPNRTGEIVIVNCENCGKELYVNNNYIRQQMFCTLGCMDSHDEKTPMMVNKLNIKKSTLLI